jgi:hypothetical protein
VYPIVGVSCTASIMLTSNLRNFTALKAASITLVMAALPTTIGASGGNWMPSASQFAM